MHTLEVWMLIGFMKAEQRGEKEREWGEGREKRERDNFMHKIQARSL